MTAVPQLSSFIGGAWRPGSTPLNSTNPADPGTVVATTSSADPTLAGEAVDAAAGAGPGWRDLGAAARGEILRTAADLLDARVEDIARDLTCEEGKTVAESTRETQLAAKVFRYFATQALDPHGETYPSLTPGTLLYTRRRPVGVVTVITPWNFPIAIPAWKIAPALAFGNTVIWKPAEIVPLTAVHLTRALGDAGLPAGVLNLVLGKGSQVGDVLTGHPDVAAVTFTGSNAVGRALLARSAPAGKKVQLELGGKNPAIVLADANLDLAVAQIATSAFGGTGQKCTATSRVIVERPVLAGVVDRLSETAAAWTVGDPLDPGTRVGPLASADQMTTVLGYVDKAAGDGVRVTVDGRRHRKPSGYFIGPTVFTDVSPAHPIACEEVFGPVVAVLAADSYEEAVTMANDTPFGLSASLFTENLSAALQFSEDSRTGIVKVNQGTSGVEYHVPFGGAKDSSHGPREQGKAARDFFTETTTVYLAPSSS